MTAGRHSYRARWVIPVDGQPIEGGTIEVEAGLIGAVHAKHDPRAVDLGQAAIIPGLVNAHTHLEFSDLDTPLRPAAPFADWLRTVVAHRRARRVDSAELIATGLRESAWSGTTLLGDIATAGWTLAAATGPLPRVVAFRELIGVGPESIDGQLALARDHLESGLDPGVARKLSPSLAGGLGGGDISAESHLQLSPPSQGARGLVRGLSPHAPYSVHRELFERLVNLAAQRVAPLAVHLAESRAELQLLEHGSGELLDMLGDFGIRRHADVVPGRRPIDWLRPLERLEHALVIHGNYLVDDELDWLAAHPQIAVVFCPRTHAFFGHAEHPWRRMLDRGVSLAIGTDSRASNPDLSVWRELQFLHARHADVDPRVLLELGTIAGARALGWDAQTGSLSVGKSADCAVIGLPESPDSDPHRLLLASGSRVEATMCRGEWIGGRQRI